MDQILSSANHPFENVESSWWLDSDEPWQTLAACMEIRNAMQSPCPENFISHLPIHQVSKNRKAVTPFYLFRTYEGDNLVFC
jgi:DNA-directed RNA polymerase